VPDGGAFSQTGGSVVITNTNSIVIGEGSGAATYDLGDAYSTGSVVEGTGSGASMTVNAGGIFHGWSDDGSLNGMQLTGTLTNNGQVVGDSYDVDNRSMNLTNFTGVDNTVENSAPTGNAGWYAVNEGRVSLPTVTAPESLTPVSVNWGEAFDDATIDLVNSAKLAFTGVGSGGLDLDISLLANDDPDDVLFDWNVGWTEIGAKAIGVWEILDGNESGDDLAGESWTVTFRYDYNLLADLLATDPNFAGMDEYDLRVYYYDTAMGRWVMLTKDALAEIDTTNKLITADSGLLAQYGSGGEGLYAVVIPEPGTLALLTLGGLGILVRRRRRKA